MTRQGKNQQRPREGEVEKLQERFRRDLTEFLSCMSDASRDQLKAMAILFAAGWCSGRRLKETELRVGRFLHDQFQQLGIAVAQDVYNDRQSTSTNKTN